MTHKNLAIRSALLALLAALSVAGCGTRASATAGEPLAATTVDASVHAVPEERKPLQQPLEPTGSALAQADIEAAVRRDLARTLNIAADAIQVTQTVTRTWPDQGLGCAARKGLYEPAPTPGYAITLTYDGKTFRYHADRQGRFVRCVEASKPLDPIR